MFRVCLVSLLLPYALGRFPVHSWDTLPAFFHSSLMCTPTWSPEDTHLISKFPIVTIEKWQGCNSTPGCYRPHGGPLPTHPCVTQQEATLATASSLRALNPSIAIISWLDSLRVYSNATLNPDILDLSYQSCVRNAGSPFLEAHPGFLLKNASGDPALESYLHAHVFDHTQVGVRELWAGACLNQTSSGLIDGCGADASQQTGAYILGLDPTTSAAWTTAHVQAVAALTATLAPQGNLVLGKVASQLGVSVNGVLQEGCAADNTTVTTLRDVAALALATGHRYLYECHFDAATESTLAAFLVGAGTDQYFGFGPWVTACGGVQRPREYELPLGDPVGEGVYDHLRGVWSRAFSRGTNVTFSAITGKGTIEWGA